MGYRILKHNKTILYEVFEDCLYRLDDGHDVLHLSIHLTCFPERYDV